MAINKFLLKFLKKEEGQTLSEYGLILFLIAVFVIGAVTLLGTQINAVLTQIANAL
jgi:pilus assembly protein Flp/PilA